MFPALAARRKLVLLSDWRYEDRKKANIRNKNTSSKFSVSLMLRAMLVFLVEVKCIKATVIQDIFMYVKEYCEHRPTTEHRPTHRPTDHVWSLQSLFKSHFLTPSQSSQFRKMGVVFQLLRLMGIYLISKANAVFRKCFGVFWKPDFNSWSRL